MSATAVLVGEMVALAVGLFWVALAIRNEQQYSTARIQQAIAGRLLAPALELQAPFGERVLQPLLRRLLQILGRIRPGSNMERLRRDLLIAGSPHGLSALDFLGLRLLLTGVGGAAATVLIMAASKTPLRAALAGVAGALLCAELPAFWLHRRMSKRRKEVTLALPDALDMLSVCVDAGMGLEGAFLRIGRLWDNGLAQELERAVMEMGVGISWREAMRNMVYRTDVPDLSSLVAVLLQAEQLGFSISDTLHAQAEQLRIRRRQRAQEMARAAPFKMLFPMVFLIMPATFAVILGPAIPVIIEAFAVH